MSKIETWTSKDQVLNEAGGGLDLPDAGPQLSRLLQPNSPELQPLPEGVLGAASGKFLVPHPQADEPLLFDGLKGFLLHTVVFIHAWVEWGANRGGYVDSYQEKPGDAHWETSADGKQGYVREINGNSIVPTVYVHGLIGTIPMTFPFSKTAYAVGREFAQRASRLRAKVEAETDTGEIKEIELRGPPVGLWLVTSHLEKKGDWRWYVPVVQPVGKVGDPNGPSLADWRLAAQLRDSFKKGDPWPPEPSEPLPLSSSGGPSLEGPKPVITSGLAALKGAAFPAERQAPPASWLDQAPPPARYDGPGEFDDILP